MADIDMKWGPDGLTKTLKEYTSGKYAEVLAVIPVNSSLAAIGVSDSPLIVAPPAVSGETKISPTGGSKTVSTSGTAERLVADSTRAQMLYVRAKSTNTGNVYFGDRFVHNTTSRQVILAKGESVTVNAPAGFALDVSEFYIDVDTNGEGVNFLYIA